ncbi:hypothetical protein GGR54DRAFT_592402 [Hypoxylon sp. NC1633]|nr:hypothetical protein GGR54DRAFT_592402 [Hypoxylon sp. NC1633]
MPAISCASATREQDVFLLPLVSHPILGRDEGSDFTLSFYPGRPKVGAVYLILKRVKSTTGMAIFETVGRAEYTGSIGKKCQI